MWPFRRRHDPREAPAVKEAIQERDDAFELLGEAVTEAHRAVREVDRATIDEYDQAEQQRHGRERR